jgi:DNA-binding response OmpR family regulator
LTRLLILLVEDDEDIAALYGDVLTSEGMELVLCRSREQARNWLQRTQRRPNLVVLDVRLPDGNGLDLCCELGNLGLGQPHPPVLVLSAHGDPRMPVLCKQAGASEFMDKMEGLDQLLNNIYKLLP